MDGNCSWEGLLSKIIIIIFMNGMGRGGEERRGMGEGGREVVFTLDFAK